ncbi:TPR repeat protein-like protein [Lentithecium fluviatile CBS 122367]|uniref:Succinate dehydrogenase assembly factor 2, mitochondrial n=1 Tax=Lentithecium fluviatile CBS 122367 TaxID=1168545 RepID=A0A6G1J7H2_9PLEO|nr:TPR repeat protein-like protein [Lentithecium fluviatile CBS 122367]
MASSRLAIRSSRALLTLGRSTRPFSVYASRCNEFDALNKRAQDTAQEYRKYQTSKPLNPHFTNTTSTIANEMPSVGKDAPPPELITNVDGEFAPKDAVPENTERMTGGTQSSQSADVSGSNKGLKGDVEGKGELGVGELEGASFKVEPLRRTGEDNATMKARLLYQSRKRGTLESELLMSTFADANLATMTTEQLNQYDLFLDENDWDIYYWATQEPSPTSLETAEGSSPDLATPAAQGKSAEKDEWKRQPAKGEWAQTVGTFKPAYRPVPARWKDSEILALLRTHVQNRSAGGVTGGNAKVDGKGLAQGVKGTGGGGLGMMPEVRHFDN